MAATITQTEAVWIAGLLGGTGTLREATPLPLDYDQVVQAVAAGVSAQGDALRGIDELQVDTLLERLRDLDDDGRARTLIFVEQVLTVDAHTGVHDAQTLAVTMTSDERVALAAHRADLCATLRAKHELFASAGEWHLVARWRSNQHAHDVAALPIACEAAQAPSVVEAVGGDAALNALGTLPRGRRALCVRVPD